MLPLSLASGACGSDDSISGTGGKIYDTVPEEDAERTFAAELCYLMMQGCDCSRQVFRSPEHCMNLVSQELEMDFAEAEAAGLEYHPECMAEYINLYTQDLGCLTASELLDGQLLFTINAPSCKVHAGAGQEGEDCQTYPTALGDDCAQGLICYGICQVTPSFTPKLEGEECTLQTDVCPLGMACLTGVCERLPAEGEPCTVGCDVGLSCDFGEDGVERTCLAPPSVGEPCGSYPNECADGSYCDSQICTPTLAPGQPCDWDDEACGPGYVCDELNDGEDGGEDDVCVAEEAFLCI